MRILVYGLNYAPEPTATGKYTGELAAWLAARGHEVESVAGLPHYPHWRLDPAYSDGKARVEWLDGVRVFRVPHFVPTIGKLNARSRIRMEMSFSISASRYWIPRFFKRSVPDVVIAVMPPMQIAVWPLLFRFFRRVPCCVHVQDLQVDAALNLNMLSGRRLGRVLYGIESFLLRHANHVSTITEAMRTRVVQKGVSPERVHLLPNWADTRHIQPLSSPTCFRRELGIDDTSIMVMHAGNMGEKQGLDTVVEAAALCRNEPSLQFVMVGDGAARPRLERKAADLGLSNLRFLPVQPLDRLADVLGAADIHLVVQRRDASDLVMPSKLTNVLAAGRVCIVTADPGSALYDVVHDHDTGVTVPPEDGGALAAAIRLLAKDAPRRRDCGLRARGYAERYLVKDRILTEFEAWLESI